MDGWIDIAEWHQCPAMERPGIIFEVRNAAGLSLFTSCTERLPMPHGWTGPAIEFRAIGEMPPRHSAPLPSPTRR